jgi:rSAM/selenodomain-associated transferase 2
MISIIIPVLNEAETIVTLLDYLSDNIAEKGDTEIIIVDGESTDGTPECIKEYQQLTGHNISLISSEKGRAKQMNAGAYQASGEILYFLHADSFPPSRFDSLIRSEIELGNTAGCFRLKFDDPHPLLKFSEWFTRFNFKFCRGGDQSLFVTTEAFKRLGGYNETYSIYEDCEFINRVYNTEGFTIIKDVVTTSARKYVQNGTWKLQYHFTIIHLKKWTGATPQQLSEYYHRYIVS